VESHAVHLNEPVCNLITEDYTTLIVGGFEVLTVVTVKGKIWVVTPCSLVGGLLLNYMA
jgi:hypothetical protein